MADNEGVSLKIFIIMGILMIIIAAGTSFMFMTYYSSDENSGEEEEEIGSTYELGEFVVNLSLDSSYKYLKADISVAAENENVIQEMEDRNPQVRDSVIAILRQQSLEEIREPDGEVIKNQIKTRLNELLNEGEVNEVWFTELVVQ